MTSRYDVVGAIERSVAESMGRIGGDAILVDDGGDELLIARPTEDSDDE
ncbi:hypothetical protein [Natronobacterium gregoryi]|uniref:Uncharacterized protein n=2 Tax=Natronobacterium gregoryi TaxID=44930 RepID=L0AME0_NATGS|nr:hypothetical protein [Natronobacterium gregoryi]AFZ74599.1 hypothetical protein Natgr_3480 [Natronobacterium gregoryi SP2]SFJ30219.1 hypothetical protein SAMN05443661_12117 [Natronobacterium gregoryi]